MKEEEEEAMTETKKKQGNEEEEKIEGTRGGRGEGQKQTDTRWEKREHIGLERREQRSERAHMGSNDEQT